MKQITEIATSAMSHEQTFQNISSKIRRDWKKNVQSIKEDRRRSQKTAKACRRSQNVKEVCRRSPKKLRSIAKVRRRPQKTYKIAKDRRKPQKIPEYCEKIAERSFKIAEDRKRPQQNERKTNK